MEAEFVGTNQQARVLLLLGFGQRFSISVKDRIRGNRTMSLFHCNQSY